MGRTRWQIRQRCALRRPGDRHWTGVSPRDQRDSVLGPIPAEVCRTDNQSELVTTVLLVASPDRVRQALRARLSLEVDVLVVGEAEGAVDAAMLTQSLNPDVVVVDAESPFLDVLSLVRGVSTEIQSAGIVVVTQHVSTITSELRGTSAMVAGKQEGLASLVRTIRRADGRQPGASDPGANEAAG